LKPLKFLAISARLPFAFAQGKKSCPDEDPTDGSSRNRRLPGDGGRCASCSKPVLQGLPPEGGGRRNRGSPVCSSTFCRGWNRGLQSSLGQAPSQCRGKL